MLVHVSAIVLGLVLLAAVWGLGAYARLAALDRKRKEAWADVLARLKRRRGLLPELARMVEAHASHEEKKIIGAAAPQGATAGMGPGRAAEAERAVSETLVKLFAVAEQHPELMADRDFSRLHASLTAAEDAIQAARRRFNAAVGKRNGVVAAFPGHLLAKWFSFGRSEYFNLESPSEKDMPTVAL